jgi:hypothetical protein
MLVLVLIDLDDLPSFETDAKWGPCTWTHRESREYPNIGRPRIANRNAVAKIMARQVLLRTDEGWIRTLLKLNTCSCEDDFLFFNTFKLSEESYAQQAGLRNPRINQSNESNRIESN